MKIQIIPEAVSYIIYQRTAYLKDNKIHNLLSIIGHKFPVSYKFTVSLKTLLFKKETVNAFTTDMNLDFETIRDSLPGNATRILDIGCGVAGVDALISSHYKHQTEVHLLDKTKTDNVVYYGFEDKTAYYNSLEVARKLLIANGVTDENIFTHDADNPETCFDGRRFDLITSFISWGFHYPLSTYLESVCDSLNENGVLIIDLREGTGGMETLKKHFSSVEVIYEAHKQIRICAKK